MVKKAVSVWLSLVLVMASCREESTATPQPHPQVQMRTVPQGVGVNIHFYQGGEKDWQMIERAGIGIVRMDVSWAAVEKSSGEYHFRAIDQLIEKLDQRKIRLLFIINYGNPLYDEGRAPFSEAGRQAYARFCSALAGRYADKGIIWELWNEPNLDHFWTPQSNVDDYMAWCRTVTPAIRQHDHDACIVAPAVSGFDFAFLESCFDRGLLELVDGVSVHPYRNARLGPESALPEYELLKTVIASYTPAGKRIPILSGEWGYSATTLSPLRQGNYLARQWLGNMAAGVPVSIWYDWHDDGQDAKEIEHHFGTVTWEYAAKPAYTAMKTLTTQLNGWMPQGRINVTDENDFVLLFTQNDGIQLAAWTIADPHPLDLGANMRIGTAVDQDGAVQEMNANSLTLAQRPLYLTLAEPPSVWLKFLVTAIQADKDQAQKTIASFLAGSTGKDDGALLRTALIGGRELERRAAAQALLLLADKLEPGQTLCGQLLQRLLTEPIGVLNQKQLLYRLSRNNPAALLPEVKPLLQEPALMEAASTCILAAAFQKAREKNSALAKEWLAAAAPFSPHPYAVDRVLKAMEAAGEKWDAASLEAASRQAGFINHWWIAGPFPNLNNQAEKTAYFPERRIDVSQVQLFDSLTARWQKVKPAGLYPLIPFADLFGKRQAAAYAWAEITVPQDQPVILKAGSNDGIALWLNGDKIHENMIPRTLTIDEDVVPTKLKKGKNQILLKVPNQGGNWQACLRVCDESGRPLDLNHMQMNPE